MGQPGCRDACDGHWHASALGRVGTSNSLNQVSSRARPRQEPRRPLNCPAACAPIPPGLLPCAAVKAINASNKTVCFEIVGYLLEELRDPDNFATFQQDLASANVFIGSLIFIEELAEKVGGNGGGSVGHASGAPGGSRSVALLERSAGLGDLSGLSLALTP
jgi:hypothetical protein